MFASTRIVRVREPVDYRGERTSSTSIDMLARIGECGVAVREQVEKHLTNVTFGDGETMTYNDAWLESDDVPLASLEPGERVLLLLVAERLDRAALAREVVAIRGDVTRLREDIRAIRSNETAMERRLCDNVDRSLALNDVWFETCAERQRDISRRAAATEAVLTTLVPKLESIAETLTMQRELEAIGMMKDADTPASKRPRKD